MAERKRPWPGPWVNRAGGWSRAWHFADHAIITSFVHTDRKEDGRRRWIRHGVDISTPEGRKATDRILAKYCDGADPHLGSGYPAPKPAPVADGWPGNTPLRRGPGSTRARRAAEIRRRLRRG